ncbi:MAG: ACP S-malonyltransferase [Planctomycetes bacterium]|nr:ACP S-malonyltransferase [Planctomycetota bacterium]
MSRAVLLCPGRGSYTEKSLKSLPPEHPWVVRAEELRREFGLASLVELDQAPKWNASVHLEPRNVSPLTWLVSMLDAAQAMREHHVVAVAGNSMGWYTALAVAGALDFDDGFRLMQSMAILQQEHKDGGQVIYPQVQEDWSPDPALIANVQHALASSNGEAFPSILLGGQAVLAGTEAGIAHLLRTLPRVKLGQNQYPFRLMGHGPYHTPLLEGVSAKARAELSSLAFKKPTVTLVDGRGARFTPWSTDVEALKDYTLGAQVVTPYDFGLSVRVAAREYAPDLVVLPGPGNPLGSITAQILIADGWRGMRTRSDFEAVQASTQPIVRSMRR